MQAPPFVWSLLELPPNAETLHSMIRSQNNGIWMLRFPATMTSAGAPLRMELVLAGHAQKI